MKLVRSLGGTQPPPSDPTPFSVEDQTIRLQYAAELGDVPPDFYVTVSVWCTVENDDGTQSLSSFEYTFVWSQASEFSTMDSDGFSTAFFSLSIDCGGIIQNTDG